MKIRLVGFLFTALLVSGYANAGTYLVYDPGGTGGQNLIQQAMTDLGFAYDVRDASTPVTASDLASHAALVVGFAYEGNYSGLDSSVLASGITGNMLITGHDADYHTATGVAAATTLMNRFLLFASASTGNAGILAFPAWGTTYASNPFGYLPTSWNITSVGGLAAEEITGITPDGVSSGLYAGLTTTDLSYWSNSFHSYFTGYGSLDAFELGAVGDVSDRVVTIGTTITPVVIDTVPEPSTFALMGLGLFGVGLLRRRMKK